MSRIDIWVSVLKHALELSRMQSRWARRCDWVCLKVQSLQRSL